MSTPKNKRRPVRIGEQYGYPTVDVPGGSLGELMTERLKPFLPERVYRMFGGKVVKVERTEKKRS